MRTTPGCGATRILLPGAVAADRAAVRRHFQARRALRDYRTALFSALAGSMAAGHHDRSPASQRKDIRVLPMSLCIAAFLSCWGPWGAFSVSLRSQEHRLMRLLEKDGLMTGGKLTANKGASVGLKDRKAISSITDYIVGQHGYEAQQPFFREDLDSMMRHNRLTDRWQSGDQSQAIVRLMNIQYATQWEDAVDVFNSHMTFYCTQKLSDSAVLIAGAQYLGNFRVGPTHTDWDFVSVGDGKLRIVPDTGRNLLRLAWVSAGEGSLSIYGPLRVGLWHLAPPIRYSYRRSKWSWLFRALRSRGRLC